jgi:hypothetical protein
MNNLRGRRGENVNGASICVRVFALHVHDAFVFYRFEFRQMCVYCRCFPRMRMHVEKRRIEHRKKKRRYRAAGRQFTHGRILMRSWFEVNVRHL